MFSGLVMCLLRNVCILQIFDVAKKEEEKKQEKEEISLIISFFVFEMFGLYH